MYEFYINKYKYYEYICGFKDDAYKKVKIK